MLNFKDWSKNKNEAVFKFDRPSGQQPIISERPPAPLQDIIDFKPINNFNVYVNALSRLDGQLRPLSGNDKHTEDTAKYHIHQAIEWLKQYGNYLATRHLRVG
jgi:hypothetical protein